MQTEAQRIIDLEKELYYVQTCLKAITTGELPETYDFNQMLYAMRGKAYLKYLEMDNEVSEEY